MQAFGVVAYAVALTSEERIGPSEDEGTVLGRVTMHSHILDASLRGFLGDSSESRP